jgi:hypothetical protein
LVFVSFRFDLLLLKIYIILISVKESAIVAAKPTIVAAEHPAIVTAEHPAIVSAKTTVVMVVMAAITTHGHAKHHPCSKACTARGPHTTDAATVVPRLMLVHHHHRLWLLNYNRWLLLCV